MKTRTLSHSTYKVAEAPASEVATSESSALPELPRRMTLLSLGTFWRSLVAWITATVHAASALRGAALRVRAAIVRAIRSEITVSVSERRRGYLKGLRCRVCLVDVHDEGEMCPKQWAGLCAICGPVMLDYYGHGLARDCDPRRGHTIGRRHKATPAEWQRSRFAVLRPEPITRGGGPLKPLNLAGKTFGLWTVIASAPSRNRETWWLVRCACGTEAECRGARLTSGRSNSCGCSVRTDDSTGSKRPEYRAWSSMLARCRNPRNNRYYAYGARGIKVCDRWLSFENFLTDMGPRPSPQHTIDRIDNDVDYTPENCRWLPADQQSANRRVNHYLTIDGRTQTLSAWADEVGVSPNCIRSRIAAGESPASAISRPSRRRKKRKPVTD